MRFHRRKPVTQEEPTPRPQRDAPYCVIEETRVGWVVRYYHPNSAQFTVSTHQNRDRARREARSWLDAVNWKPTTEPEYMT